MVLCSLTATIRLLFLFVSKSCLYFDSQLVRYYLQATYLPFTTRVPNLYFSHKSKVRCLSKCLQNTKYVKTFEILIYLCDYGMFRAESTPIPLTPAALTSPPPPPLLPAPTSDGPSTRVGRWTRDTGRNS